MANTDVVDIAFMDDKDGNTIPLSSVYSRISKNASLHKALDFSNVGMPINNSQGDNSLRQFHQTRIYVQGFGGMLHHGSGQCPTTYLISANLPEAIGYNLQSEWQAPFGSFGSATANLLMQLATGALSKTQLGQNFGINGPMSLANRATTLKVWGGTKPLHLKLDIPVIDDGFSTVGGKGINTNLTEALEFLGSLCLPQVNSATGFYTPPPSPLSFTIKYGKSDTDSYKFETTYGRIMVQLGGILLLDRCVIKGISVNYSDTKAMIKHTYASSISPGASGTSYLTPLLAKVTIELETLEALTSNMYSKMLWLKPQDGSGEIRADVSSFVSGFKNATGIGNANENTGK